LEITNIWQKSRDFSIADFFLEIFKIHRLLWIFLTGFFQLHQPMEKQRNGHSIRLALHMIFVFFTTILGIVGFEKLAFVVKPINQLWLEPADKNLEN
jgi:hypothetical protein